MGKFNVRPFETKTLSWWRARRPEIDMDPPYQRSSKLWTDADKAYLIDSVINDFDIPKFYLAEFTSNGASLNSKRLPFAIIDGKQRFEALFDFFDGKIPLSQDFVFYKNRALKLGGFRYPDLMRSHSQIAEIVDNYNLSVMSVTTESTDVINEMFVRLNRSKPLTGAEIRNAMGGPAPDLIRQIADADFFKKHCKFPRTRGQHRNAAAKILMFEFHERLQETKKSALDSFVREAAKNRNNLANACRRALLSLNDLAGIFLPDDHLLASAGLIPDYYWFIRQLKRRDHSRVRSFLASFEEARKNNRLSAAMAGSRVDQQLLKFDQFNRSTNDLNSHDGRTEILLSRFKAESG